MTVAIIVQARMSSTRLPGKIIMPIMGRPVLEYQLDRLRRVRTASEIVVATTTNPADQAIVELASRQGFKYFRGSETDVLSRFYYAAKYLGASVVVRCNSDCPLIDPDVVDQIITAYQEQRSNYDYVSNILQPTYPTGMHTEVFPIEVLEKVFISATDPVDREHVTPYIYHRPNIFRLKNIALDHDISPHRWTLDYPEDFDFITRVYESLYPTKPMFSMADVLEVLHQHPEWLAINGHIKKNATV
jgi:spore coat polysaccharide biosynthesis protein SpsF